MYTYENNENPMLIDKVREIQTKRQTVKEVQTYNKFYIELEWDDVKQEVVAKYYNYLNELQEDFDEAITFKVGEQEVTYEAFSGVATCPISGDAGEYLVETANEEVGNARLVVVLNA